MKQLSEQELNQKIASFLESRFAAHPEIGAKEIRRSERSEVSVVSRVKNFSKRFVNTQLPSLYQN